MKAISFRRYGPPEVLALGDMPKPEPNDKEILLKVVCSTVTLGDCELRGSTFPLFMRIPLRLFLGVFRTRKPHILGQEASGVVEAVGKDVVGYAPGDRIFAMTGLYGSNTDYVCLPEESPMAAIAPMGPALSFEHAAAIPVGGLNALHFLRKLNLQRGEKLLIIGAGGSIGTFAVQLAHLWGAEVTAVDRGDKLDMLREIGAARGIDYTAEDYTKERGAYDAVFDVVCKAPFPKVVKCLKQGGRFAIGNPRLGNMIQGLWTNLRGKRKVFSALAEQPVEDMIFLRDLIADGKIKPVIDRTYPLEDLAEAHRYVEGGHKKGCLIISVNPA